MATLSKPVKNTHTKQTYPKQLLPMYHQIVSEHKLKFYVNATFHCSAELIFLSNHKVRLLDLSKVQPLHKSFSTTEVKQAASNDCIEEGIKHRVSLRLWGKYVDFLLKKQQHYLYEPEKVKVDFV